MIEMSVGALHELLGKWHVILVLTGIVLITLGLLFKKLKIFFAGVVCILPLILLILDAEIGKPVLVFNIKETWMISRGGIVRAPTGIWTRWKWKECTNGASMVFTRSAPEKDSFMVSHRDTIWSITYGVTNVTDELLIRDVLKKKEGVPSEAIRALVAESFHENRERSLIYTNSFREDLRQKGITLFELEGPL